MDIRPLPESAVATLEPLINQYKHTYTFSESDRREGMHLSDHDPIKLEKALEKLTDLARDIDLTGKKVLEIGGGSGHSPYSQT